MKINLSSLYPVLNITMFCSAIYNSIINRWGDFLYSSVKSLGIVLFICVIISLILLLLFLYKKLRCYKILIFLAVSIILLYFILIGPFKRGERISELRSFGMNVVEQIHTFEKENAKLPDKLDDLYPKYLDDEVLKQSKRISKYNVLKVESDKYGKSETYFTFTIYEDYMDFEYLSYNKAKNNFILTDE